MALRLCVECGARPPRPPKPCGRCGAAPSTWVRVPFTRSESDEQEARRILLNALVWSGATLVLGVGVYLLGGSGPVVSNPIVVLQAFLLLAAVGSGAVAFVCLLQFASGLSERRYRLDDGERVGTATGIGGRLWEATGSVTKSGVVFAPGAPDLTATLVFDNIRHLARDVGRALQRAEPSAIDLAITAGLLGLAARGRCELVVRTVQSWRKAAYEPVRSKPPRHGVWVRRCAGGEAPSPEEDAVEAAILAAFGPAEQASPSSAAVSREGDRRAPASDAVLAGDLVSIGRLVSTLVGDRPHARGWLRGMIKTQGRREGRNRPRPRLLDEPEAAALGRRLAGLFARGADGVASPSAALLFQVEEALSALSARE